MGSDEQAATDEWLWADFWHMLMNVMEFIFVRSPFMIQRVAFACQQMVEEFNSFWALALLSDYSFEEGDRTNKHFGRVVDSYEESGVPLPLVQQLRNGVNINLASVLSRVLGREVQANRWKGHDLLFDLEDGVVARIEVKVFGDCTTSKWYPIAAHDWVKLAETCRRNNSAKLFQVIFFSELPSYVYSQNPGPRKVCYAGIQAQYERLVREMRHVPDWPKEGEPWAWQIRAPEDPALDAAIQRRFREVWGVDSFDVARQLKRARVGCAVWEYNGARE